MTTLLGGQQATQGCRGALGTPLLAPGLGSTIRRPVGQHLLVSGVLWGFSIRGWAGILHLPGVQSFCPHGEGASCPFRSFPSAQGQGIGRVDAPHAGSDGWGGPAVPQSWSGASGIPQLHRGRVCSELCAPAHPGSAPSPPAQGGQQGCRQEPFADSEDFLHECTNHWLILLARGLGSKCGGLRNLLLLCLGEAGGCQWCQQSGTASIPPAPSREAKDIHF